MMISEAPAIAAAEELFSETADGDWFLLRTRSRQEKIIAADLSARRVANFLPLMRCVRYYGGHKAVVDMPLFPGYVFLRGTPEDAYSLDRSGRIVLKYVDDDNHSTSDYPANPNGSAISAAGVCDDTGRVFGLMPHPERFVEPHHHPRWTSGRFDRDRRLPQAGDWVAASWTLHLTRHFQCARYDHRR